MNHCGAHGIQEDERPRDCSLLFGCDRVVRRGVALLFVVTGHRSYPFLWLACYASIGRCAGPQHWFGAIVELGDGHAQAPSVGQSGGSIASLAITPTRKHHARECL